MDEKIDRAAYWAEVAAIAGAIAIEGEGEDDSGAVHEAVGDHEWVIYHALAAQVLTIVNPDEDEPEVWCHFDKLGWSGLVMRAVYSALVRDVHAELAKLRAAAEGEDGEDGEDEGEDEDKGGAPCGQ